MDIKEIEIEFNNKFPVLNRQYNELLKIIIKCNEPLEGNCYYWGKSFWKMNNIPKLLNLYYYGRNATKIGEIGFNAGHSTLLMLLGKGDIQMNYTIFDINEHKYTMPCFLHAKEFYPNIHFDFVDGDSILTMPKWIDDNKDEINTFDLIYVDGGHTEECIINDLKNSDILIKVGGYIIIDDINYPEVINSLKSFMENGKYVVEEIPELMGVSYQPHPYRVIKKIK